MLFIQELIIQYTEAIFLKQHIGGVILITKTRIE